MTWCYHKFLVRRNLLSQKCDSEDEDDIVEPASKITTFREAIDFGNYMKNFRTEKGEEELSEYVQNCSTT